MKKLIKMSACGLMAAMLVTGCSKEAEQTETGAASATVETVEAESIVEVVADGQEKVILGQYKGLEYVAVEYEVTDEDVELELLALLDANPVVTQVNRPAQDGDIVNIDYVGKKDGVAFDGGTAQGYDLVLGSGTFIDGFEEGLIGAESGQTVNLDLTFPEEYHSEELAGQAVVFEVTVNAVKEEIPATLSDSFVAQYTEYTTVEEYRAGVKQQLMDYVDELRDTQMKNELYTQLLENTEVTVSESTVAEYFDLLYANYENMAAGYGMDVETLASYYGMDIEAFKANVNLMAQEAVMNGAIFGAIADAEGITITDEEREELAAELGYGDMATMIEAAGQVVVDNYLLSDKVINFVAENAVAVEAPAETAAAQ